MRNLFQSFKAHGLEYILISGQASVIYGAATFSEDIDIWINPANSNIKRLLKALAKCDARVYPAKKATGLPVVVRDVAPRSGAFNGATALAVGLHLQGDKKEA